MKARRLRSRCRPFLAAAGLLYAGGCLSTLEQTVDLALAPGAVDNALVLPYTGLSDLAFLLSTLLAG